MKWSAPTYQPGNIRGLKSLDEEIEALEAACQLRTENFYISLSQLPREAVKKTLSVSVSLVLGKMMAGTSTKLLSLGIKLLLNNKAENKLMKVKSRLLKNAGKMGIIVAAKMAFNKMMNKEVTDPV